MNKQKIYWNKLLPVFLSFIVMGFVDIIGVATSYVQKDFEVSDFVAQFLPMMVLVWFFILSVPAGLLQDKYGKRNMMNIGMLLQAIGLGLPFVHYSFGMMFSSFILLGAGNTIIQVSANPLLQDVSPGEKLASYLSISQFIKAMISFSGPIIATFMARIFGNWKLVFAVYAGTTVLAAIWLSMTPIVEAKPQREPATFSSCFRLLKNRFVVFMSLSIFLIVGAEVAINTNITKVMIYRYNIGIENAAIAISVFFAGETIARLLGAIILNWVKPVIFLMLTTFLSLLGIGLFFASPESLMAFFAVFITGLGIGNMFPIIFSISLKNLPERSNELSGLLIMSVSGGAVIPPIAGFFSTFFNPLFSMVVIGGCMLYMLWVSMYLRKQ